MKKIISSKLFLVFITALICISMSVYATTTYYASQIIYNNATLDNTLDNLYTSANTTITDLESEISTKNNTISNLESEVSSKSSTITNLQNQITQKDNTISEKNSTITTLQNQLSNFTTLTVKLASSSYNTSYTSLAQLNFSHFVSNYKYVKVTSIASTTGYNKTCKAVLVNNTSTYAETNVVANTQYTISSYKRITIQSLSTTNNKYNDCWADITFYN